MISLKNTAIHFFFLPLGGPGESHTPISSGLGCLFSFLINRPGGAAQETGGVGLEENRKKNLLGGSLLYLYSLSVALLMTPLSVNQPTSNSGKLTYNEQLFLESFCTHLN